MHKKGFGILIFNPLMCKHCKTERYLNVMIQS